MSERVSSEGRSGERLSVRRRRSRRRMVVFLVVLFCILLGAVVYGLRQSQVRIKEVVVYGADQSFAEVATSAMQGSYFGVIPRDSTFFFPASRIRDDIITAHPDIAAVSIFRNGFTSLTIKVDYRAPIARWCGLSPTGGGVEEYCYLFDASGLIFAAAATTTETINGFTLYAPLAGDTLEPLLATVAHAEKLPAVFDFARQLGTFGSPTERVVIRGDEVDEYLTSGTRVTYVLGNEENAFTALSSARANLDLADGSVDYIDLRFGSKVYLKKK